MTEVSLKRTENRNAPVIPPYTWRTMLRNALVITRREVRDSFRDWRIVAPIFLLTLVFPLLANVTGSVFVRLFDDYNETDRQSILEAFLPLMPMLVGFFPISISLVIALETFVGEKERLSLEPLLSTPLTNAELYIGKVLAAIIPPLAAGYMGITIYLTVLIVGAQQWRPDLVLLIQIVLLTFVQAVVMVTGAVVISSQTTSTRAANLLASFIIIPMSLLVISESLIMIKPSARPTLWWIMLGLVIVIILLMRTGTRIFNREELLGRSIDHLNLKWAWQVFSAQWVGGVETFNPILWYQKSVFPALLHLRRPISVFFVGMILAFAAGWIFSLSYGLPLEGKNLSDEYVMDNLRDIFETGMSNPQFMALAFIQNVRVLTLAIFISIFTFGVIGLFLTLLPFGIFGYIMGSTVQAGISPLPFIAAIVPHGIAEIPAIIIGGAAALQIGAIITSPPQNMTVIEAWLRTLADTLKLFIFVVLPLLLIAAILEVQLTPRVVEWVVSR